MQQPHALLWMSAAAQANLRWGSGSRAQSEGGFCVQSDLQEGGQADSTAVPKLSLGQATKIHTLALGGEEKSSAAVCRGTFSPTSLKTL